MALLRSIALLLLPPCCLAISLNFGGPGEECRDAMAGEKCYRVVEWLRWQGFVKHPDWYPGLSRQSTFQEVQEALFKQGKANCTKPCPPSSEKSFAQPKAQVCYDAVEGDSCFHAVMWLKTSGLQKHPTWYPRLNTESTEFDIQAELHRLDKAGCATPCEKTAKGEAAPSGDCRDAEQSHEKCHTAVEWARSEGIKKHPDWYPGLTAASSFRDFQEFLFLRNRGDCPRPCGASDQTARMASAAESDCNGGLCRRKMPVEAMTLDQLNRYLSGEWDGTATATAEQFEAWEKLAAKSRYSVAPPDVPEALAAPAELSQPEEQTIPLLATTTLAEAEAAPAVEKPVPDSHQALLARIEASRDFDQGEGVDEPLPVVDQDAVELDRSAQPTQ